MPRRSSTHRATTKKRANRSFSAPLLTTNENSNVTRPK